MTFLFAIIQIVAKNLWNAGCKSLSEVDLYFIN